MKNVLMILILFAGFAINASAQQNCKPADCKPCPPGCCMVNCCTSKGAAASIKGEPTSEAQLASLMLGTPSCNMTKKEVKACLATCKSNAVTTATESTCKPVPACQPTTACKSHQQAVDVTPVVYRASALSKS